MEHAQNGHGFGLMAVSLGYFETLMSASGASTSSELTPAERARAGISPGLVRMSVGLTGTLAQRMAQLLDCLGAVPAAPSRPTAEQVGPTRQHLLPD
jgi:methionine-gamma-lyase